jgi:lauroyl/myristoyl acyltransferase
MIYWLLRSASWLARLTPDRARQRIAGLLCEAVYWCWPEKRHNTINNMAHVLGRPPTDRRVRQLARRSWRNYGRYLGDFFNFPNLTGPQMLQHLVDVSPHAGGWPELAKEALARGKGIIITTAHFGNWDVAGAMVAARISMAAIVVDRPMTPSDGTPITFFGSKTYVPGGPAALALKAGATILPGFAWYAEGMPTVYYGRMYRPIIAEPVPGKSTEAQVAELTQRIYDALEAIIREAPAQWYMFRSFWPEETIQA